MKNKTEQIKLMKAIFKASMMVEMIDDLTIENARLFKQKDKNVINSFKNHYLNKYGFVINDLFNIDLENESELLEKMKKDIDDIMENTLEIEYEIYNENK